MLGSQLLQLCLSMICSNPHIIEQLMMIDYASTWHLYTCGPHNASSWSLKLPYLRCMNKTDMYMSQVNVSVWQLQMHA